jgi:predicted transcriptional regulator
VRLLEKKGYLGFKAYGKTYEYFPLISKAEYRKHSFRRMFTHYFDNSATNLVSFLVNEEQLSSKEVEQLRRMLNQASNQEDSHTNDD